jgi:cell division protein FtsQ
LRLPVFTRYPFGTLAAAPQEMSFLRDIIRMSQYLQQDEFLMALVSQVDCVEKNQFELFPAVGDQVIEWGDGSAMEEKFRRLKLFYLSVVRANGLDYYERIKLQFDGQVVGVRKEGMEDKKHADASAIKISEIIAQLQREQQQQAEAATQSVIQNALQENRDTGDGAAGRENKEAIRSQNGKMQESQKIDN